MNIPVVHPGNGDLHIHHDLRWSCMRYLNEFATLLKILCVSFGHRIQRTGTGTWVMVTWSLKNCRSATRTSKLALAFSKFFSRRAFAYENLGGCRMYQHLKLSKIWNYMTRHIEKRKKRTNLFQGILEHDICSQPKAHRITILDFCPWINAFRHFKISNECLQLFILPKLRIKFSENCLLISIGKLSTTTWMLQLISSKQTMSDEL